jgi:hypothetical protein
MSTYSFATSAGFATSANITLLQADCTTNIHVPLTSLTASGDSLIFYFASTLSSAQKSILATIVAARDTFVYPIPNPGFLTPGSNILKHNVNGIMTPYVGEQYNEIHISKEPQGQYSSLAAAMAANPQPNMVYIIHPGTYVEPNPLIMPYGTVIIANGNAENTYIVAANPGADLIVLGLGCKLEGVTFTGASNTGSRGVYFDCSQSQGRGSYSAMFECFIVNCDVCIECDGKGIMLAGGIPDTLYSREIIMTNTTKTSTSAVYSHAGGQFIGNAITVEGVPPNPLAPSGFFYTYGYRCVDQGSKIAMSLSNCYFCNYAVYLDNNCNSEIAVLTIGYCGCGVTIGPNGTTTRLSVASLGITNTAMCDIEVLPTNAIIQVHSGVFDDTKIVNPNGVPLNMHYHTDLYGESRMHLLGVIGVGTPTHPSELYLGEGYYDIYNNAVLQNTNLDAGTWTNVTTSANQTAPPTVFNVFAGTTVNNCLYLGRNEIPVGIRIDIITPALSVVPSSSLEYTYWNGTSWIPFSIMQTVDVAPYHYMTNSFVSTANVYHIRFGLTAGSPLVQTTLNSITKYWVRVRVVTALPSMPTTNYIYFHSNSAKYNTDGFEEYFGDARAVKNLNWNITNLLPNGMTNTSLYLSSNLEVPFVSNTFPHGVKSSLTSTVFIPNNADTSFPLKIKFAFVGSVPTTGNVVLTATYGFSPSGTAVYTSLVYAPATAYGEKNVTTIIPVSLGYSKYVGTLALDLTGVDMNPADGGPQVIWITITRNSTATGTDTYLGNVILLQIAPYYVSWINGGHLLSF